MDVDPAAPSDQLWDRFLAAADGPDDEFDDDVVSTLVRELNRRAEPELVTWALPLLSDPDDDRRWAAAWALQDHGTEVGRRYTDEIVPVLVAAAAVEPDDEVRAQMVRAIGHSDDPAWAPDLLRHADDPAPGVRLAVASQLPIMYAAADVPRDVIEVLIGLTRDAEPEVRDWATMAVGGLTQVDTPTVRAALHDRLDDQEGWEVGRATAGEALLGLARRHDRSVRDRLVALLGDPIDEIGNLTVEAASEFGDRSLLPMLWSLRDRGWADQPDEPLPSTLAYAIETLEAAAAD